MEQNELNQEMLDLGVQRYRKNRTTNKGSLTNAGRRIMREGVEPVALGLVELLPTVNKIKNKSQWQRCLVDVKDFRPIALIAVKATLDVLDEPRSYASVCFRLGRAVEDQLLSDNFIRNHEFGSRLVKRMQDLASRGPATQSAYLHKTARSEDMEWTDWTRRDRISCGSMLLEIVHDRTGLIKFTEKAQRQRRHFKPMRMVEISDVTREWINDYDTYRELLLPFWLPMVESPEPWHKVFGGGYGINKDQGLPVLPFIRCSDRNVLRMAPDMPQVYNAVNLIQETPYAINNRVLEMLEWAWDKDLQIGLPPRNDLELPEWPGDHMSVEEQRNWRDDKRERAAYNTSLGSQRILISKILMLSRKFRNERMFMPSSCDFRGRVYQVPSYLNYQGPDHCRGLLQFHRGNPIKSDDDLRWLGIHGANCFGNDKCDFETRLKWADGFTRDAIRIANDPKSNREWADADEPWQALAWCFEWAEYHTKRSKNFRTFLPCAMDATNSGLQLLSLLSRDAEGCFATNVSPTSTPQDIYRLVSDHTLGKLKQDAKDGRDYARLWIEFGIDRKMSKRPVMCYSYGLTPYSNRDYVADWYDTTRRERGIDCVFGRSHMYPAIKYLGDLLWDSIQTLLTKPKQVMDWFQDVSRLMTRQELPLTWTTPSGFRVSQDYRKQVNRKVSTWLNGSLTSVRFKDATDDLDPRKQSNGVAPNVVHSLDAAGLVLTVNESWKRGLYDFAMIHDSFATHSNNCETLASSLRDSFAEMFTKDILAELAEAWQNESYEELPSPPDYGTFDVNTLRDSKYFFS